MADLTRAMAKDIVVKSLRRIADFNGDVETYNCRRFGTFHKEVFLAAIKAGVLATVRDDSTHNDVDLTVDTYEHWPTIGDCISWYWTKRTRASARPEGSSSQT